MVHRVGGMEAMSGLQSTESVRQAIRAAVADPEVDSILLEIDSPGGEVDGTFDLADEVFEARGKKPIVAVATETAASGAFALASAADRLFLPRTGRVGSVGVFALHVDQSVRDANQGIKVTHILNLLIKFLCFKAWLMWVIAK